MDPEVAPTDLCMALRGIERVPCANDLAIEFVEQVEAQAKVHLNDAQGRGGVWNDTAARVARRRRMHIVAAQDGRRIKLDREPAQHGVVVAPVERDLDSRLLRRLIADLKEDLGGAASIVRGEAGTARRDSWPPTQDPVRATEENNDVRLPITADSLQSFLDSIPLGSRRVIALVERHADGDRVLDQ